MEKLYTSMQKAELLLETLINAIAVLDKAKKNKISPKLLEHLRTRVARINEELEAVRTELENEIN